MANPLVGEVVLPLGEATYTLQYDVNALCEAEEALDASVEEILERITAKRPRMVVLRGLLWAGLRRHHPALTVEEVGQRFFGPGGLGTHGVMPYVGEALRLAFPKPGDGEGASGEADPPPATPDGTGSASSASGES